MIQDSTLLAHRGVLNAVSDAGLPLSPGEVLRFLALHNSLGTLLVNEAKKQREQRLPMSPEPVSTLLRSSPGRPDREIKRRLGVDPEQATSPTEPCSSSSFLGSEEAQVELTVGSEEGGAHAESTATRRPWSEAAEAKKAAAMRREELERRIVLHRVLVHHIELERLAMGRCIWRWGHQIQQAVSDVQAGMYRKLKKNAKKREEKAKQRMVDVELQLDVEQKSAARMILALQLRIEELTGGPGQAEGASSRLWLDKRTAGVGKEGAAVVPSEPSPAGGGACEDPGIKDPARPPQGASQEADGGEHAS